MGTRYKGTDREIRSLNAYIKLSRAHGSLAAYLNRALGDWGLTLGQLGILEALYHLGPLNQTELSSKLLNSGGNIVMIVDNLEKRGFVLRKRDDIDRRKSNVNLTEQGEQFIASLFPRHVKTIVGALESLTDEELDELGRLCKKIGFPG